MIDTNEIAGWISSCRNAEYLRQIRYAIEERLKELLGAEGARNIMAPRSAPAKSRPRREDTGGAVGR